MERLFELIETYFEADEWHTYRIHDETACSMKFRGKNGQWICVAETFEDEEEFVFYSACPVQAPAEMRSQVAELLHRINYELIVGNFELNFDDGDIRCRTSISVMGHSLGAMLISQIVYQNVLTMDHYLPAIQMVIEQQVSPQQALNELETQLLLTS